MKISKNPMRSQWLERLRALPSGLITAGEFELFRFINPRFAKPHEIISGAGALQASGRWNLRGEFRVSYTAFGPEIALAEALAHVRYFDLPLNRAMPTVLVALGLKVRRAVDLRDPRVRKALGLSEQRIRQSDWRRSNREKREAPTQAWGWAFASAGFEAAIVPSVAQAKGANVLVFPDQLHPGSRFSVKTTVDWERK